MIEYACIAFGVGVLPAVFIWNLSRQGKEHYEQSYLHAKEDLEMLPPEEREKYINSALKSLKGLGEEELKHPHLSRWLDIKNPAKALLNLAKEYGIRDKNWEELVREYKAKKYKLFG